MKTCSQHSVHNAFLLKGGGGVEPQTKFSKRGGGLTGPQLLEGVAGKKGGNFFSGRGCNFHPKN